MRGLLHAILLAAIALSQMHSADAQSPPAMGKGAKSKSKAKTQPLDPWNRPYEYTVDGDQILIRSAGPDGAPGTPDDITNR